MRSDGGPHLPCNHPRVRVSPLFATTDYITGKHFAVGYCNSCNFYVTTPVPTGHEIQKYYPKSYYGSGRRFAGVIEWLLDHLYSYRPRQIEQKQKPGKVLDIGCGRGLLLNKLRQRGWDPYGTELSEDAAAYARDVLHLPVTTRPLDELSFPDNEFDLVIIWHVLEHVTSPLSLLDEVARILKPGGYLLVAVPNFGSWEARWAGKSWFHLDVPRHLTHFTPRTLRPALKRAGLSPVSTNFFSIEYDFFSFVQTVQNKLGFRHNLLYNLLRTRSARLLDQHDKSKSAAVLEATLALLSAIPLALLSLVYTPLMAALGKGATMAIYAKKEGKAKDETRNTSPFHLPTPGCGGPFSGSQ